MPQNTGHTDVKNLEPEKTSWIPQAVLELGAQTTPVVGYIDYITHKVGHTEAKQMLLDIVEVLRPLFYAKGYKLSGLVEFYSREKKKMATLVIQQQGGPKDTAIMFVRLRDPTNHNIFLEIADVVNNILAELTKMVFPGPGKTGKRKKLTRQLQLELAKLHGLEDHYPQGCILGKLFEKFKTSFKKLVGMHLKT